MTTATQVTYTLILTKHHILNANSRHHWREKARRAAFIRDMAARQQYEAGHVLDRAHCTAVFTFRDQRRRDPLNWAPTVKPAIDGLVSGWSAAPPGISTWHGLLPDDDATHLTGPDLRIGPADPAQPAGTITLTLTFTQEDL